MKILLAEDDPDVREAVAFHLEGMDCEVYEAKNGTEAWEAFQKSDNLFDAVVTDNRMPGMCGLELSKHIRKCSTLPILMMTADSLDLEEVKAAGVSVLLQKPVPICDLEFFVTHVKIAVHTHQIKSVS